ncbi:LCI fold-containing protein [Paenibacillus turicensis]|uniref:LCI fold-containing protein n=1 Tax=Paenibacillus turicensis TaxID=160487 RepID=UPI003D2E6203
MNVKKILFSSVLTLSMMVSAAPAFASEGQAAPTNSVVRAEISPQAIINRTVPNTVNVFANSFTENGVTWYLKGISYSGGMYYGHYQANI